MFISAPDMITPFSSKALEAVLKAIPDDGPCPTLKEWDSTSPIFPTDSDAREAVASTFTAGKLLNDCASYLFTGDLPWLPNTLLNTGYGAHLRIARSLHTMALTEPLIYLRERNEAWSLLGESLFPPEVVREALDRAEKAIHGLHTRWGLFLALSNNRNNSPPQVRILSPRVQPT